MYKRNNSMMQEKTWNMDALFTERINNRLNELDIATYEANQGARYRILWTIYVDTHFKYKDQAIKLKTEFKDVKNVLSTPGAGNSRQAMAQHQSIVVSKAETMLDDLHLKIMDLLYECDLICLKMKKGLNPEQEFERDYS